MFNSWDLTWDQVQEVGRERKEAVVDFFGYLLCSRDRALDERHARHMYLNSLRAAREAGKKIRPEVLQAETHAQKLSPAAVDPEIQERSAAPEIENHPPQNGLFAF